MLLHENPQILASCFACGMRGLALGHKDGSKAVLSFFEKVFALCADDGGAPLPPLPAACDLVTRARCPDGSIWMPRALNVDGGRRQAKRRGAGGQSRRPPGGIRTVRRALRYGPARRGRRRSALLARARGRLDPGPCTAPAALTRPSRPRRAQSRLPFLVPAGDNGRACTGSTLCGVSSRGRWTRGTTPASQLYRRLRRLVQLPVFSRMGIRVYAT
jgi:hypothetical protein